MKKSNFSLQKIGITIGDINGVAPQVILKAFTNRLMFNRCNPIVYGNKEVLLFYKKQLNLNDISINSITTPEEAVNNKINVIDCFKLNDAPKMGISEKRSGEYAKIAIVAATKDVQEGLTKAIVTAPINKSNLPPSEDGTPFTGHTELLEELTQSKSIMLMVHEELKVGLVTNHLPIKEVPTSIQQPLVLEKIRILNTTLKENFNIQSPKIAVLGLNPHSGDNGVLGTEETAIINAINHSKSINIMAFGPYPADGFFGSGQYAHFDGILAMYHDQGLAPFKTLSFGSGVNFTAGLPFVRTSPDHGTAYDIVKKGTANCQSFRNAIYLAIDIIKNKKL